MQGGGEPQLQNKRGKRIVRKRTAFTSEKFTGARRDGTKPEDEIKSIVGAVDNAVDASLHTFFFCQCSGCTTGADTRKCEYKPG